MFTFAPVLQRRAFFNYKYRMLFVQSNHLFPNANTIISWAYSVESSVCQM